jgi:hypothetical protein
MMALTDSFGTSFSAWLAWLIAACPCWTAWVAYCLSTASRPASSLACRSGRSLAKSHETFMSLTCCHIAWSAPVGKLGAAIGVGVGGARLSSQA